MRPSLLLLERGGQVLSSVCESAGRGILVFLFIVAVQRPCFHQSSGDWIYFIHKVSIELYIGRGDFLLYFILLFCKTCSKCIFTETCECKCHVVYFKMLPVDPGHELRSVCSCCHFLKREITELPDYNSSIL